MGKNKGEEFYFGKMEINTKESLKMTITMEEAHTIGDKNQSGVVPGTMEIGRMAKKKAKGFTISKLVTNTLEIGRMTKSKAKALTILKMDTQ